MDWYRQSLPFHILIWAGPLTEKNLLPLREKFFPVRVPSPGYGSKLQPVEYRLSRTFHSIPGFVLCQAPFKIFPSRICQSLKKTKKKKKKLPSLIRTAPQRLL